MQAHRLRVPRVDGAILAEPAPADVLPLVAANRRLAAGRSVDYQGRGERALRARCRADALGVARAYHESAGIDLPSVDNLDAPWIVTGHQPELFHPGVWVKNFAAAALARASGGIAVNLIVDNDIPKGPSIRVPERRDGTLKGRQVAFDDWAGEVPFEDQTIRDASLFASFPDRVRRALGAEVADPLVDRFWHHVESAPASMPGFDRVGLRFARARRLVEAEWGVHNVEVPLSRLCETDGFLWFAAHLLAHLPRFRDVHNDALARYRACTRSAARITPSPTSTSRETGSRPPSGPGVPTTRTAVRSWPGRRGGRSSCGSPARPRRSWRSRSAPTARRVAPWRPCASCLPRGSGCGRGR